MTIEYVQLTSSKGCTLIQAISADEDDKDHDYDSRIFFDRNAQNLRHIKQRKRALLDSDIE